MVVRVVGVFIHLGGPLSSRKVRLVDSQVKPSRRYTKARRCISGEPWHYYRIRADARRQYLHEFTGYEHEGFNYHARSRGESSGA